MRIFSQGEIVKSTGTNGPEKKGHAEQESEIANSVYDESFITGKNIISVFTVVAD